MKERVILNEVFRMSELMGIDSKKTKRLVTEAILGGGGIIDDFIELLGKKSSNDIAALGFRNADDIQLLVKNFPTASVDDQVDILKQILKNASEQAFKTLAKEIIGDVSTVVGAQLKTVIDDYTDLIGKYPNLSADVWADKITKDLSEKFKGSQVPELTDVITREAAERIRTVKGNVNKTPVGPTKEQMEELFRIENELAKAKGIDDFLRTIKNSYDWKKTLGFKEKNAFEKYVKQHDGKTIAEIKSASELEFKKLVAGMKPGRASELFAKFRNLPWWGQVITLMIISGSIGLPIANWAGWLAGKGFSTIDLEDAKKGFEEGMGENPEETPTTEGCPGSAGFTSTIQAVYTGQNDTPTYDASKITFDETTCSGTYDGVSYKWENNDWKQN
jgi:hypothetical protein